MSIATISPNYDAQIALEFSQVSEITVNYFPKFKASERPKVQSSLDSYNILRSVWNPGKIEMVEEFKLLLMNRANKVLGVTTISVGGVAGTVADPKIIFGTALKCLASGIILAHNHPSGNLNPSQADIHLTKKLKEGGSFLDLPVFDHLIITKHSYYSFADEGLL